MSSVRAVLFDLDGTLTDPGEGIIKSLKVALVSAAIPVPSDDRLSACIGPPLHDSFRELGAEPGQVANLIEIYRTRYRDVGMFENAVYPGVPALLERLTSSGCRLFVATSKPTSIAEPILEHFKLRHFFERVYGTHLDGSLGNKVELLSYIHSETRLVTPESAFVGDRRYDMTAAREHGMRAIGVLWGYGSRGELEASGAHHLVASPGALAEALAA